MDNRVLIERGVLSVDGHPDFLLSADYPYYRDHPEKWPLRLAQLKQLGIGVISFYVPWRHHEVDGRLDFTGETMPSRNVIGFLELLRDMGLKGILKPGPFIHAELNFGGLPDRLDPHADPRLEPMLDAAGNERLWHRPLPAPLCEQWQAEVAAWYQAVREQLIEPFAHPVGPVVALQVLNEGIYSDANRTFTAYDYSPSALRFFAERRGGGAGSEPPRQAPDGLTLPADARPHMDWALTMGEQLSAVYRFTAGLLEGTGLPLVSNMHPPENSGAGLDWWLAKVTPEDWGPVQYGFTNWIGCVSHDTTAFYRYLVLVKRMAGPNLEENWGFSDIYDSRYQHTVIPFYQTLLAMAAGTTGINVYTGAGTDGWTEDLDRLSKCPYPDTAPIGHTGEIHPKGRTLSLLADYLGRWGREWTECNSDRPVAYAIYPPYAALAGWSVPADTWQAAGVEPPVCGAGGLDRFMVAMRQTNQDFGLFSLTGPSDPDPAEFPVLTLVGGFFMDAATQERLSRYVRKGGHLVVLRELPRFDGDLSTPCPVLMKTAEEPGAGRVTVAADFVPLAAALAADAGTTQVWIRRHPTADVAHVVILSVTDDTAAHRVRAPGLDLAVTLPGRSGALVRVENGRLSAALVKGINDCDGHETVPVVTFNGETVWAQGAGDWYWVRGEHEQLLPWTWR